MSNPTVHFPRDGLTYMIGECGGNSVSSTTDFTKVTCVRCLEIINKRQPATDGAHKQK